MSNISNLTDLINAFRAETAPNSISPDSLGALLQKIVDDLQAFMVAYNQLNIAGSQSDIQSLQSAVDTLRQAMESKADVTEVNNKFTNGAAVLNVARLIYLATITQFSSAVVAGKNAVLVQGYKSSDYAEVHTLDVLAIQNGQIHRLSQKADVNYVDNKFNIMKQDIEELKITLQEMKNNNVPTIGVPFFHIANDKIFPEDEATLGVRVSFPDLVMPDDIAPEDCEITVSATLYGVPMADEPMLISNDGVEDDMMGVDGPVTLQDAVIHYGFVEGGMVTAFLFPEQLEKDNHYAIVINSVMISKDGVTILELPEDAYYATDFFVGASEDE